jgi:hypothetical protein
MIKWWQVPFYAAWKQIGEQTPNGWNAKPDRLLSAAFLWTFLTGIIVKWFWLGQIETADFGILCVPILGLMVNLAGARAEEKKPEDQKDLYSR